MDIIKVLFVDMPAGKMSRVDVQARQSAIKECSRVVKSNIVDILDTTSETFEALNGEKCAVCIQVLEVEEGKSIETANVITIARDSDSAKQRSNKVGKNKITDNSLNKKIYVEGSDMVIINNLKAAIKSGEVITTSTDAGNLYNSIFIIPIPYIGEGYGGAVAALCIDNLAGFRSDRLDICTYFAHILTWRAAAMLYTISALEKEFELLKSHATEIDPKEV